MPKAAAGAASGKTELLSSTGATGSRIFKSAVSVVLIAGSGAKTGSAKDGKEGEVFGTADFVGSFLPTVCAKAASPAMLNNKEQSRSETANFFIKC